MQILSENEATDLAFARDSWVWIKAPIVVVLLLFFLVEAVWKAGTDLVGSVACTFSTPCFAGPGLGAWSLWLHFLLRLGLIAGVTRYSIHVLAYLSLPGLGHKLMALVGIAAFFPLLLGVLLVVLVVSEWVGFPLERILMFENRYVPFEAWRHGA